MLLDVFVENMKIHHAAGHRPVLTFLSHFRQFRRKGQVKSARKSKTNKQREEDNQRENIEDGDSTGTSQESESPVSDDGTWRITGGVSWKFCLLTYIVTLLFLDYTHGAKRQPKSLQTSKVAKQRKYDFQPKDDQDSELSEDSLRDRANSRSYELGMWYYLTSPLYTSTSANIAFL